MVFFINDPRFDVMKKRSLLALIIVLMSSAWTPIAKDIFLEIMNKDIGGGITVGLIVSVMGLFGAYGLYKRWF